MPDFTTNDSTTDKSLTMYCVSSAVALVIAWPLFSIVIHSIWFFSNAPMTYGRASIIAFVTLVFILITQRVKQVKRNTGHQ